MRRQHRTAPDCIVITAARDIESVRAAISLGAVYYLVKPFGFAQLQQQLEAYRRWRDQVTVAGDADQTVVDKLYELRRPPDRTSFAPASSDSPTAAKVLTVVRESDSALSAADIADRIGISRPTAQRHLHALMRRGSVQLDLAYGATGRPVHLYRAV